MTQRLLGIVLVHAIGACGGTPRPAGTDDAGTEDAGTEDAGTDDAGTDDAGEMDAQIADAALPDAAPFDDAGGSSPLVVRLLNYVGAEPTNVAFVAFQDGEGPWQTVTGINGSYLYSVSHNRYGIVYACTSATAATVNVVYATPGEISLLRTQCPTDLPTVNISGTVTGIPNDGSSVSIVTSYEGSGTATYAAPTYLSGWNSLWGLMPPGDTINWSLSAYDSNRTVADIWIESEYRGPLPGGTDGLEIRAARISGMSTP